MVADTCYCASRPTRDSLSNDSDVAFFPPCKRVIKIVLNGALALGLLLDRARDIGRSEVQPRWDAQRKKNERQFGGRRPNHSFLKRINLECH